MTTDFFAAYQLILNHFVQQKIHPDVVEDFSLIVLSDMHIDDSGYDENMFIIMKSQYDNAGIKLFGKPYKLPIIIFWDLRKINGVPSICSKKNSIMISGFSQTIMDKLLKYGTSALQNITSFDMINDLLNSPRYNILIDNALFESFNE
jgi:hypothetical protein